MNQKIKDNNTAHIKHDLVNIIKIIVDETEWDEETIADLVYKTDVSVNFFIERADVKNLSRVVVFIYLFLQDIKTFTDVVAYNLRCEYKWFLGKENPCKKCDGVAVAGLFHNLETNIKSFFKKYELIDFFESEEEMKRLLKFIRRRKTMVDCKGRNPDEYYPVGPDGY